MSKDFRALQYAFAAHLRNPKAHAAPADIEDRRMKIYRDLFFNNIRSLLAGTFPVLHRILGAERWALLVRDFYHHHISHTPLFMEVPQEFLAWLAEEFRNDGSWPAFLQELAHYEWLELAAATDARNIEDEDFDANGNVLDRVPVISPVAFVAAYRYPVHRIGPGFQPDAPGEQPTFLVVYRRRNDDVGFTEVNAVTARLLERLQQESGATGRELLDGIAKEIAHPDPQSVIRAGGEMLAALQAQDIILGTR